MPALAQQNVVLENHTYDDGSKGSIAFRRIEFTDTNLSRDDVAKLFSATTSREDMAAIARRLKAARIAIPSVVLTGPEARMTLADFVATDVDADAGKVKQLAIGTFDVSFLDKPTGALRFKSGPLQLDGANIVGLLQAIRDKDLQKGMAQFTHFSVRDVEGEGPDKDTPADAIGGNLTKVKIAVVSADATFNGGLPLRLAAKADNVVVEVPPSSDGAIKLKEMGIDRLDLSFGFAGIYDPTKQTYGLDDLTVAGAGLGAVTMKGRFTGVEPGAFSSLQSDRILALLGAGVAAIDMRFTNGGIAEKVLQEAARQQNQSVAALKGDLAKAASVLPLLLGGNANGLKIADALARFVDDPKQLAVSMTAKSGSLGFIDLLSIRDPASLFAVADVQVAANQVADNATPPAASPGAAAAPDQPLSGPTAWQKLIGNSISGKDEDGNPLTEYYLADGTVKQLVDDATATGKWVIKGDKVCFTFPDDEEDEEACYNVTVDGTIATFTDDEGSGRRYEILPGNPKRL
ncbi:MULTISPECIES: hypothetical protein [unclassified Beijerinckia]|uniref:hypothetical protein n=1 Tax=unclassified Beijerinckia TaxID=2638183 RepID=UPI0011149245|nr:MULTISPECIES: hypothetical protein [unclassified Beijerinckia]